MARGENTHILIVDDQPLSYKLMEALLRQENFKTSTCTNGYQALKWLEDNKAPDLILMDVMMPEITGFDTCIEIKKQPHLKDIPIIFVTARDDSEAIRTCFSVGGADYAPKPLRVCEFLARINLQIESNRNLRRAKESESTLEDNKALFEGVISEIPAHIFVINPAGEILLANQAFADFFGKKTQDILNRHYHQLATDNKFSDIIIEDFIHHKEIQALNHENRISFEDNIYDLDKNIHHFISSRLRIKYNNELCTMGISVDVTDIKEKHIENEALQKQLQQSHKMELVGTLAGGIAHDFNNMLAVILGYSELVKLGIEGESKAKDYIEEVLTAGTRAKDLVAQILNFSRQSDMPTNDISVSLIIKEVVKMVRSTLPSDVELQYQIPQNLDFINADETKIHQILMNLCVNAHHAIPDGGTITIHASNFQQHESDCPHCQLKCIPERCVHIEVHDTGVGMNSEVCQRIFEPYFTTKDIGEGTGLGLAVVQGIVTQHRGHICVESQEGQGTSFHIYFPSVKSESEKTKNGIGGNLSYGEGHILIVDDEVMVGKFLAEMLAVSGYTCDFIEKPKEALETFKADPEKYQLIITDYMMPHMKGDQLAIEMKKIKPQLPIILATGYSDKLSRDKSLDMGIDGFITKPVLGEVLTQSVKSALAKYAQ